MKLNPIQSWSAKFLKIISPIQSWSAKINTYILFCFMKQMNQRSAGPRHGEVPPRESRKCRPPPPKTAVPPPNLKPKCNFTFISERPLAIPSFLQKFRPEALLPPPSPLSGPGDEHGSGLKPILAGSGLDRTEKIFFFNVIILKISNISVVIRFHRFAKW